MYQAIVFLPLLGAVLAGLIALAGARARFPGKGPAPGGEDHATDHGAPHGGAVSHASPHAEEHAPAAAGSRTSELITTTLLMICMILSWIAFVDVGFAHHDVRVPVFTWMTAGDLKVEWSLRIDTLTAVMLVVVNTISAFVHLYSIGYMHEDPYRPRFFAWPERRTAPHSHVNPGRPCWPATRARSAKYRKRSGGEKSIFNAGFGNLPRADGPFGLPQSSRGSIA